MIAKPRNALVLAAFVLLVAFEIVESFGERDVGEQVAAIAASERADTVSGSAAGAEGQLSPAVSPVYPPVAEPVGGDDFADDDFVAPLEDPLGAEFADEVTFATDDVVFAPDENSFATQDFQSPADDEGVGISAAPGAGAKGIGADLRDALSQGGQ